MNAFYEEKGITLYNQDCFLKMKQYGDKSFDMVLTSPPFLDKEVEQDYYTFLDKFVFEANRLSDVVVMFNSSRRIVEICRRYDNIQAILIWDKIFTLPAFKYEPIFVITQQKVWGRGRIYRDCLRYKNPRHKMHINENPVELYEELMRFFPKCARILDPFVGSGTTLVAARQMGRQAVGIEKEREICEVAKRRLEAKKDD